MARARIARLESVVQLRPGEQLLVSYTFRRMLQRWNEFVPDANHGYFLPASVLSYQLPTNAASVSDTGLPLWAETYDQWL